MGFAFRVIVYEPKQELRDWPNLKGRTQRAVVRRQTKGSAIRAAINLICKRSEVRIWKEKDGGRHLVENWLPTRVVLLSDPKLIRVESNRKALRYGRLRVDWYLYKYRGSDGRYYHKAIETPRGTPPHVPLFGSQEAINLFQRQWECWDCNGTGYRDGDIYAQDRESCFTCGGKGYVLVK